MDGQVRTGAPNRVETGRLSHRRPVFKEGKICKRSEFEVPDIRYRSEETPVHGGEGHGIVCREFGLHRAVVTEEPVEVGIGKTPRAYIHRVFMDCKIFLGLVFRKDGELETVCVRQSGEITVGIGVNGWRIVALHRKMRPHSGFKPKTEFREYPRRGYWKHGIPPERGVQAGEGVAAVFSYMDRFVSLS